MRLLGPRSTIRDHELDLLYTAARCKTSDNEKIRNMADELLKQRADLLKKKGVLDQAEEAATVADAMVAAKDTVRDETLVEAGAMLDAIHPGDRDEIFRLPPSKIARKAYADESHEIEAVIARLNQYSEDDLVRKTYAGRLEAENKAFTEAQKQKNNAQVALSTARLSIMRAKTENDEFRQKIYGRLVTMLGKADADLFFRSA